MHNEASASASASVFARHSRESGNPVTFAVAPARARNLRKQESNDLCLCVRTGRTNRNCNRNCNRNRNRKQSHWIPAFAGMTSNGNGNGNGDSNSDSNSNSKSNRARRNSGTYFTQATHAH
jgi:hypothetical protein